ASAVPPRRSRTSRRARPPRSAARLPARGSRRRAPRAPLARTCGAAENGRGRGGRSPPRARMFPGEHHPSRAGAPKARVPEPVCASSVSSVALDEFARQLEIGLGPLRFDVVGEDRLAEGGSLAQPDVAGNHRLENAISEMLADVFCDLPREVSA